MVGASVEGSSHRAASLGCDDAHAYFQAEGLLVLAVADGAGSAQFGGEGARIAVEAALGTLIDSLGEPVKDWDELLRNAVATARYALKAEAASRECPLSEFAATLLLAVCTPDCLTAAQLGDGAIVARQAGGWERLCDSQKGEHINETMFLTVPEPMGYLSTRVQPAADLEAIILLTDGLEPLAFNLRQGQPHSPFFEALYRFARRNEEVATLTAQLCNELRSDRLEARTDDDKTLVIAVPN